MKQKIALTLLTLMGLALLGYTALRTLDLIQLTLPADQQAIGYLALVAFDGGFRVDPIVKTRKWGELRCGWPFSSPEK
jgi:hypothetical protein